MTVTLDKLRERTQFGLLLSGCLFVREADNNKRVYFALLHGRANFPFPVLEDGTVSRHSTDVNIFPTEVVNLVRPQEIGITSIKPEWVDEKVAA